MKLAMAVLEHNKDWGVYADRIGFALHERGGEAISFSKPRSNQTHQRSPIKAKEKGYIPANLVKPSTHHLNPDEMAFDHNEMASDPNEMAAVYSTLTTVENLVEVKPAVAKMVCERTKLLKWLLGSGLLGSRFCSDEVVLVGFWVSMWFWWLKKCGLWLLGFDDFLVLNFLGLWVRDLMILLELKMRVEFLFWAYDFFFELNFLVFLCVFVSQENFWGWTQWIIFEEHEHVLQKKIIKEIIFLI